MAAADTINDHLSPSSRLQLLEAKYINSRLVLEESFFKTESLITTFNLISKELEAIWQSQNQGSVHTDQEQIVPGNVDYTVIDDQWSLGNKQREDTRSTKENINQNVLMVDTSIQTTPGWQIQKLEEERQCLIQKQDEFLDKQIQQWQQRFNELHDKQAALLAEQESLAQLLRKTADDRMQKVRCLPSNGQVSYSSTPKPDFADHRSIESTCIDDISPVTGHLGCLQEATNNRSENSLSFSRPRDKHSFTLKLERTLLVGTSNSRPRTRSRLSTKDCISLSVGPSERLSDSLFENDSSAARTMLLNQLTPRASNSNSDSLTAKTNSLCKATVSIVQKSHLTDNSVATGQSSCSKLTGSETQNDTVSQLTSNSLPDKDPSSSHNSVRSIVEDAVSGISVLNEMNRSGAEIDEEMMDCIETIVSRCTSPSKTQQQLESSEENKFIEPVAGGCTFPDKTPQQPESSGENIILISCRRTSEDGNTADVSYQSVQILHQSFPQDHENEEEIEIQSPVKANDTNQISIKRKVKRKKGRRKRERICMPKNWRPKTKDFVNVWKILDPDPIKLQEIDKDGFKSFCLQVPPGYSFLSVSRRGVSLSAALDVDSDHSGSAECSKTKAKSILDEPETDECFEKDKECNDKANQTLDNTSLDLPFENINEANLCTWEPGKQICNSKDTPLKNLNNVNVSKSAGNKNYGCGKDKNYGCSREKQPEPTEDNNNNSCMGIEPSKEETDSLTSKSLAILIDQTASKVEANRPKCPRRNKKGQLARDRVIIDPPRNQSGNKHKKTLTVLNNEASLKDEENKGKSQRGPKKAETGKDTDEKVFRENESGGLVRDRGDVEPMKKKRGNQRKTAASAIKGRKGRKRKEQAKCVDDKISHEDLRNIRSNCSKGGVGEVAAFKNPSLILEKDRTRKKTRNDRIVNAKGRQVASSLEDMIYQNGVDLHTGKNSTIETNINSLNLGHLNVDLNEEMIEHRRYDNLLLKPELQFDDTLGDILSLNTSNFRHCTTEDILLSEEPKSDSCTRVKEFESGRKTTQVPLDLRSVSQQNSSAKNNEKMSSSRRQQRKFKKEGIQGRSVLVRSGEAEKFSDDIFNASVVVERLSLDHHTKHNKNANPLSETMANNSVVIISSDSVQRSGRPTRSTKGSGVHSKRGRAEQSKTNSTNAVVHHFAGKGEPRLTRGKRKAAESAHSIAETMDKDDGLSREVIRTRSKRARLTAAEGEKEDNGPLSTRGAMNTTQLRKQRTKTSNLSGRQRKGKGKPKPRRKAGIASQTSEGTVEKDIEETDSVKDTSESDMACFRDPIISSSKKSNLRKDFYEKRRRSVRFSICPEVIEEEAESLLILANEEQFSANMTLTQNNDIQHKTKDETKLSEEKLKDDNKAGSPLLEFTQVPEDVVPGKFQDDYLLMTEDNHSPVVKKLNFTGLNDESDSPEKRKRITRKKKERTSINEHSDKKLQLKEPKKAQSTVNCSSLETEGEIETSVFNKDVDEKVEELELTSKCVRGTRRNVKNDANTRDSQSKTNNRNSGARKAGNATKKAVRKSVKKKEPSTLDSKIKVTRSRKNLEKTDKLSEIEEETGNEKEYGTSPKKGRNKSAEVAGDEMREQEEQKPNEQDEVLTVNNENGKRGAMAVDINQIENGKATPKESRVGPDNTDNKSGNQSDTINVRKTRSATKTLIKDSSKEKGIFSSDYKSRVTRSQKFLQETQKSPKIEEETEYVHNTIDKKQHGKGMEVIGEQTSKMEEQDEPNDIPTNQVISNDNGRTNEIAVDVNDFKEDLATAQVMTVDPDVTDTKNGNQSNEVESSGSHTKLIEGSRRSQRKSEKTDSNRRGERTTVADGTALENVKASVKRKKRRPNKDKDRKLLSDEQSVGKHHTSAKKVSSSKGTVSEFADQRGASCNDVVVQDNVLARDTSRKRLENCNTPRSKSMPSVFPRPVPAEEKQPAQVAKKKRRTLFNTKENSLMTSGYSMLQETTINITQSRINSSIVPQTLATFLKSFVAPKLKVVKKQK